MITDRAHPPPPPASVARAPGAARAPSGFQSMPSYESKVSGDFTLTAGHALLDVGQIMDGINDKNIAGAGPDVGAYERGGMQPGPAMFILRADAARKLPATPDDTFLGERLPWVDPDSPLLSPPLPSLLFYLNRKIH